MLNALISFITFKSWRATRRRKRYDEIRALIVKEHLAGNQGMVVPAKFDPEDMKSFRAPMYQIARNQHNQLCIFWDKKKMTEEVGSPTPKPTP